MLANNVGCMRHSQGDYLQDQPRINQTVVRGETRLDWTPPVLRCHTKVHHWTAVQDADSSYNTQYMSTRRNDGKVLLKGTFLKLFRLFIQQLLLNVYAFLKN